MTVDLTKLVKPLVWYERDNHFYAAESQIGMYYITEYAGMSQPFKLEALGWFGGMMFDTLAAAQAAAQADYAAALDGDAVAAMIAEAVRAEREAMVEVFHQEFIWGALDNVHDAETTLDDYAAAVSRAQLAAIRARGDST